MKYEHYHKTRKSFIHDYIIPTMTGTFEIGAEFVMGAISFPLSTLAIPLITNLLSAGYERHKSNKLENRLKC